MSAGILDSLNDINYNGEIHDVNKLEDILQADFKSEQFLSYGKLVAWLTQELNSFYSIGEYVQNMNCMQQRM